MDVDLTDEQFRLRPAIVEIVRRIRARRAGDHTTRAQAAADLARFEGLSDRSRGAILSYFPDEE